MDSMKQLGVEIDALGEQVDKNLARMRKAEMKLGMAVAALKLISVFPTESAGPLKAAADQCLKEVMRYER